MLNVVCFIAAAWLVGMGCRCMHRHVPHPSKPCSRYPPPSHPAPKGAPSVVAPRVICPLRSLALAPLRPPRGAHVSIPLVCATFPDFWLYSHTTKVK